MEYSQNFMNGTLNRPNHVEILLSLISWQLSTFPLWKRYSPTKKTSNRLDTIEWLSRSQMNLTHHKKSGFIINHRFPMRSTARKEDSNFITLRLIQLKFPILTIRQLFYWSPYPIPHQRESAKYWHRTQMLKPK